MHPVDDLVWWLFWCHAELYKMSERKVTTVQLGNHTTTQYYMSNHDEYG